MKPLPPCKERRLVWRLLHYWEALRGDRPFPLFSDIRYDDIDDIWPHCFVLDARDQSPQPFFHYLGPSLAGYGGIYLSGKDDWTQTLLDHAVINFPDTLSKKTPILSEELVRVFDGSRLLYRSILLPLSHRGETIDYVLGAANCMTEKQRNAA